jgi:DNA-nicking Smr family endonuclease
MKQGLRKVLARWFTARKAASESDPASGAFRAAHADMPAAKPRENAAIRQPSAKAQPATREGKPPGDAAVSARRRATTRHGIARLAPEEERAVFLRDSDVALPAAAAPRPRASIGRVARVGEKPRSQAATRTRHGIRRLEPHFDLRAHFSAQAVPHPVSASEIPQVDGGPPPASLVRSPRSLNRHGIPQLDRDADLCRHFAAANAHEAAAEDLAALLTRSLSDGRQVTMKRKSGGAFPARALSLKETLRRYPNPQAQLDLHGLTARQAQLRIDRFVRASRADGLFTLRIIVGKGLHSEAGAVLPDVAESLLVDLKRQGLVLSFAWDRRAKKKSGALVVYLTSAQR